jgi:hypothetical protein
MVGKRRFDFFLLRYVPHAVREQYVDFALILTEKGNEEGFTGVRFAPNWRGVLNLDPQADVELLEALEREITGQLSSLRDREVLLHWVEDCYSNAIQVSPRKPCLAEDPLQEIELLASIYLSETQVAPTVERKESGRSVILSRMQAEFERTGSWELLIHGISCAEYTKAGDSFKFDCGYRVGETLKMFHAVSLRASVNAAIEVASKYRRVAPAIAERKKVSPLLTAIVDDDLDRAEERISYTLNAMRDDGIRIFGVAEMPQIAELAWLELRK